MTSRRPYDTLKRALDIVAALLALVVLSPVLLVIALLVRLNLGSPVIFRQQRPGKDGKLFTIHKFRTMREAPVGLGSAAAVATDGSRLTPLGRALRSSSLDELPEFFDVLLGTMSVVGPRPLLPEYLERYDVVQARRHDVRPGITGWAQVNGRNAPSWDARLAMDVWYVDHRSLALDAKVVARTFGAVFGRTGVNADGVATVTPFEGTASAGARAADDSEGSESCG